MVVEVNAETIGRAARRDMQIAVPVRPAVRRGVRLRRSGDTVVLDGADRPQAFTGRFARDHLTQLVAACDGTLGHRDLAARTGLDEGTVYKSLALLWAAGAVEEGDPPGALPAAAPEFACLLSRLGNSTGANRSWTGAARRLARTVVHLAGDPSLVATAARCLDGAGRPVTGELRPAAAGEDGLSVFFETRGSAPDLAALRRRCWTEGRPLLRVRVGATAVTVGPYVDPAFTPCLECGTAAEGAPDGDPPAGTGDLVAGLVTHHVTALVGRATMTHLPLDAAEVDLSTLATRYRAAVTRPGCPTCSFAAGVRAAEPPAAARYEAAVAIPPRRFLDPKGHLAHYQSANIALSSQFRTWPTCPRRPLPAADLTRLAGEPAGGTGRRPGPREVALLLAVAFGVREQSPVDGAVRRWTAAAGNIGSATAYLLCRDDTVLPAGAYAYVEQEHALAGMASGTPPPGNRPLLLVITANLRKVVRKYGTFGLRLALLDAGCAVAAARAVAGHLGLAYDLARDFDDDVLAECLGLLPSDEPVAAVLELG
ncbi:tpaE [Actinoplanes sp. SE50]|uniref:tpaE n=1 Tax=unclassified Actinoplanes TaxID=2626549 RepID=UPI00023EC47A|nr:MULTISPECIES: tpaE [unclassified Actinoplanes]AEV84645.1 hypothetical protein ACPL_3750 [Actinoplanes sp. SE50/110]ATO83037.1 tpaE [Actinoplanes sp. SE50]SLM00445.1 tpaE [Actinoplanes sp. SE50/110]